MTSFEVAVFPRPRSAARGNGQPVGRNAAASLRHDPGLPPQGYRIVAGDSIFELSYADELGARYGRDTVNQLRASDTLDRVDVTIEDWPDFVTRGYMLDVSRDRVPNRRELERLVRFLSRARYNQLELYVEHTFAYRDHPEAWEAASPLTADDIVWLDQLCAGDGIALVCNQNTLGHMERWLEHERYIERAELPEGIDLVSEQLPPTTLTPTADNAAFVRELLQEALPLFSSKRVNIGGDEPWEFGRGKSKELVERHGLGNVYADYVTRVTEPFIDSGYTVEFWADVIAHHPDAFGRMPRNTVPLVWMYNSPHMMQTIAAQNDVEEEAEHAAHDIVVRDLLNGFRDRARSLVERGIPFWVCPGTNAWRSMTGRLDEGILNLIDAAEVGLESGSEGYLLTSWGNQGYWDPPVISIPPLVAGAAFSWCLASNRDLRLGHVLDEWFFRDKTSNIGEAVCLIGHVPELLGMPLLNTSPLWVVIQSGGNLPQKHVPDADGLARARDALASARVRLDHADPQCEGADVLMADLYFVIDVADFAVDLIVAGMSTSTSPTADQSLALLHRLESILFAHVERWAASARYGGLMDSLSEMEPLRRRLQRLAAQHL